MSLDIFADARQEREIAFEEGLLLVLLVNFDIRHSSLPLAF
jgi:hypothetical protein